MTAAPAIHLDNVSWTYAGAEAPALAAIDLTIGQGETVVLAGASGSGKSTTLRLMNGLIPHLNDGELTGDIRLFGSSSVALDLAEFGRSTGSVWQHPFRQFLTSTVADEIAFAMENHAEPPERMRGRVDELLTDHDLSHLRNRRLSTLSSGQQQLVALLAAIAHRPPILLLDEPTANLSDKAAARLLTSLDRLRSEGTTIVIAEHRVHPFISMTHRIVYFRDGRIDTTWTPGAFLRLSDHELVTHGLRSRAAPPHRVRPAVASGRSIAVTTPAPQKQISDAPTHQAEDSGITIERIRCVKDSHVIVDIEYAHFPAGRVTVLRGANGAGKTTLARIIVGLQRHTGTVTIDGAAASRRLRRRRSMLITQEVQRQLFADTVRAELDLAATGSAATVDAADLLAQLDLHHLEERHPLSLSGGQQQRLAIAVARLNDRSIVILDEPSTGVDRRHLRSISDQIRHVAADGAVVLLISHDDDLLALAADRQLTMTPAKTERAPASGPACRDRTKEKE